jgi:hypothetical protein
LADRGTAIPRAATTAQSTSAASKTRDKTIVKGGNSATARAMKKKELPQMTDRPSSIAHSARPKLLLMAEFKANALSLQL